MYVHIPILIISLLTLNERKLECSRWYTIANTHFSTFDHNLGIMVTQNVAEYPPHHVTHGPWKFEVTASKG